MRRQSNFSRRLQRGLTLLLLLLGVAYLGYEGLLFFLARQNLPAGQEVAGVDVGGLSREAATEALQEVYSRSIFLHHRDEQVEIPPAEIAFTLDVDAMLDEAMSQQASEEIWEAYLNFLLQRPASTDPVPLRADYDRAALQARLESVAGFLDEPPRGPQPVGESLVFQEGRAGFTSDIEASLANAEAALLRPENRTAQMVIKAQDTPPMDMAMLQTVIENQLLGFSGLGSFFIMDLASGEELSINGDVAMSGLSMVKIAILLETYRAIDGTPTLDQRKLISETAVFSGNFSANLLLDVVAGQDNAYLGADILTESMRRLGLRNTFIAVPYEEPARAGLATYVTPANSRTDVDTDPDPAMQTTAEDIGSLLAMIYYCAQGGGPLLAVYEGAVTPEECAAILSILNENVEGNLIRFGVPEGTIVAHKHGWAGGTHGDAGLVFSPGGDYVIVEYLHQDGGWLVADISFPILRQISRITYNFFNTESPYVEEREIVVPAGESGAFGNQ